jgi:xanthine dehydrogenase accessory factor
VSEIRLFPRLKDYINRDRAVTLAVVVRGPDELVGVKALIPAEGESLGSLLEVPWRAELLRDAQQLMRERSDPVSCHYENGNVEVFFDIYRPLARLIIVGAVHIADSLIRYALTLGFRTYLVDPRTAFATRERFPLVNEMHHQWPDEALPEIGLTSETAVVVITHDPKLDDPALKVALPSPAFYVGALGSPKTHAQRVKRLLDEGLSQEQLDQLHAPIGLNIGGRSPAEISLSIMAEIIATRNGKPLDDRVPHVLPNAAGG